MSSEHEDGPRVGGWRDLLSLVLLSGYVLLPALLGMSRGPSAGPMLPGSVLGVLAMSGWELVMFTVVLGTVCRVSKLGREDFWWRWVGGWRAIPRAFLWSFLLRLGVGVLLGLIVVIVKTVAGASMADADGLRADVGALVAVKALRDPVYQLIMITLVSFVVAGLREELWRAGMISLLGRVFPSRFGGERGAWLAVVPVAVLFGLGHSVQGVYGVYATLLLGVGLGALLLWRGAIADAVLAHGFFNATTFVLLPWLADRLPGLAS